jgi:hypothetical protein
MRDGATGVGSSSRIVRGLARAVGAYASYLGRRCEVENADALSAVIETSIKDESRRPFVFCYFIADVMPLMVVASRLNRDGAAGRVRWVCDDTLGGALTAEAIASLGGSAFLLPWASRIRRIDALRMLRRSVGVWGVAVDGHGPYGHVSPALGRFLAETGAVVIPIGASASPRLTVTLRAALQVPLPWSLVASRIGVPLDFSVEARDCASVLEKRLADLTSSHV